jgi:hypothetical protein
MRLTTFQNDRIVQRPNGMQFFAAGLYRAMSVWRAE